MGYRKGSLQAARKRQGSAEAWWPPPHVTGLPDQGVLGAGGEGQAERVGGGTSLGQKARTLEERIQTEISKGWRNQDPIL